VWLEYVPRTPNGLNRSRMRDAAGGHGVPMLRALRSRWVGATPHVVLERVGEIGTLVCVCGGAGVDEQAVKWRVSPTIPPERFAGRGALTRPPMGCGWTA